MRIIYVVITKNGRNPIIGLNQLYYLKCIFHQSYYLKYMYIYSQSISNSLRQVQSIKTPASEEVRER